MCWLIVVKTDSVVPHLTNTQYLRYHTNHRRFTKKILIYKICKLGILTSYGISYVNTSNY